MRCASLWIRCRSGVRMAYDPSFFERQRRTLTQGYASEGAMRAYQQFLSQRRGQRDLGEFKLQADRQMPQVVASYGRRGLMGPSTSSGIFRQGMADYASDRIRRQSELERSLLESEQMFGFEERMRQDVYNQSLADLESDKARQIASDAQQLLAYRAGM